MRKINLSFFASLLLLVSLMGVEAGAIGLEAGFKEPPVWADAYVWWHWMNGNVTHEGITADLEAMNRAGIGGAWIFNVAETHGCNIPAGDADYLGGKWLEMKKFAAKEADRLGLELGMHNCAGWARMGGPWIEPKDGMQAMVSTVLKVDGGKQISVRLPQPETKLNFYRDIAVLVYLTPENEKYRVHQWMQNYKD